MRDKPLLLINKKKKKKKKKCTGNSIVLLGLCDVRVTHRGVLVV